MATKTKLKEILAKIGLQETVTLYVNGCTVSVSLFDGASKLFFSTLVYCGDNYLPKSVRRCLAEEKSPFFSPIKTYLTVDESRYSVYLNYLGMMEEDPYDHCQELIEEFCWQADRWRELLDRHDKDDLVYVPLA